MEHRFNRPRESRRATEGRGSVPAISRARRAREKGAKVAPLVKLLLAWQDAEDGDVELGVEGAPLVAAPRVPQPLSRSDPVRRGAGN
jgi:hypothetical protein